MEDKTKKHTGSAALLESIDDSVLHTLESIKIDQSTDDINRALLYIRKIPQKENPDKIRFADLISHFRDESGNAECEMRIRNPENENESVWVKTKFKLLEKSENSSLFATEFENITTKMSLETKRRNQAIREAIEAAHKDSSTGVYNKCFTEDVIRDKLAKNDSGISMLLILDIDLLKNINDTYGHPVGDKVLKTVAEILRSQFRQNDIIGRVGGDEFMALISGVSDETSARGIVERLLSRITDINICGFNPSVSIGCVLTETGREDFDILYKKADKALYHVKRNGKNNYDFYTSEND